MQNRNNSKQEVRSMKKNIKCKECENCKEFRPIGNKRSNFYCEHPDIEYIREYYRLHKITKMVRFIGFGEAYSHEVPIKSSPAWCPKKKAEQKVLESDQRSMK